MRTSGAHSTANVVVRLMSPAFAAPYADAPGEGRSPETLDTFTMQPPSSCTAITLCADCAHHNGARRFRLITASTKRGDMSAAIACGAPPGVVHQHVETAEVLDRLRHHLLRVRRLAHVGAHEQSTLDLRLVATTRHHMCAGVVKRAHDLGTDAHVTPR